MTLISEVLHAPMLKLKLMSELIDQLQEPLRLFTLS